MNRLILIRRIHLQLINKNKKERKEGRKKERKNKNLPAWGFGPSGGPQKENKVKRKDRQILGPSQKIEKGVE